MFNLMLKLRSVLNTLFFWFLMKLDILVLEVTEDLVGQGGEGAVAGPVVNLVQGCVMKVIVVTQEVKGVPVYPACPVLLIKGFIFIFISKCRNAQIQIFGF